MVLETPFPPECCNFDNHAGFRLKLLWQIFLTPAEIFRNTSEVGRFVSRREGNTKMSISIPAAHIRPLTH